MAKQWTKEEKLKVLEYLKTHKMTEAAIEFDVNKNTILRWKQEFNKGGESALKWGNGNAAKSTIKKYKDHSWILKDPDDMDIDELREALRLERALKKAFGEDF